ncbi:rRNA maturation RNase YbeY [bacterium]|nr:rRNA maturation RNase YbeY [bacterium]
MATIYISTNSIIEFDLELIENYLEKILKFLNLNNSELSLLFVDDEEIKELNRVYRKKDKVTDVLSFPQNEGIFSSSNYEILGDIVISLPQAERQSEISERSFFEEVVFLSIHSILHLIGYDHMEEEDEKIMQKREDEIFYTLFE